MIKDLVIDIILSGAGTSFVLFILARIIPNEKVDIYGYKLGKFITIFCSAKLGKACWKKSEEFFENSSVVFLQGLKRGLHEELDKND